MFGTSKKELQEELEATKRQVEELKGSLEAEKGSKKRAQDEKDREKRQKEECQDELESIGRKLHSLFTRIEGLPQRPIKTIDEALDKLDEVLTLAQERKIAAHSELDKVGIPRDDETLEGEIRKRNLLVRIRDLVEEYSKAQGELNSVKDYLSEHVEDCHLASDMARNAAKLLEEQKDEKLRSEELKGGKPRPDLNLRSGDIVNIVDSAPYLRDNCILLGVAEEHGKVKVYDPSFDEVVNFGVEQVERKYKATYEDNS